MILDGGLNTQIEDHKVTELASVSLPTLASLNGVTYCTIQVWPPSPRVACFTCTVGFWKARGTNAIRGIGFCN